MRFRSAVISCLSNPRPQPVRQCEWFGRRPVLACLSELGVVLCIPCAPKGYKNGAMLCFADQDHLAQIFGNIYSKAEQSTEGVRDSCRSVR